MGTLLSIAEAEPGTDEISTMLDFTFHLKERIYLDKCVLTGNICLPKVAQIIIPPVPLHTMISTSSSFSPFNSHAPVSPRS